MSAIAKVLLSKQVTGEWYIKDPGHSAKSIGGRLHLNTHTPLTQRSRSGLTMPLSRYSVGTCQETSSHATRQGTLGRSAQRVELVYAGADLHFRKKKKKKRRRESDSQPFLKSSYAKKKQPPPLLKQKCMMEDSFKDHYCIQTDKATRY